MLVNEKLIYEKIKGNELLTYIFELLENDEEVQALLKMANINAVERLFYNDHGLVHSRIVSGAALEILDRLVKSNVLPSVVTNNIGTIDDAKIIVLISAYLHDIGNSIHRTNHHLFGAIISSRIVERILSEIYPESKKRFYIKSEILNSIFSHDESVNSITIESGIVKVADGLDMAEGRARIPYRLGKADIHAFSALSIKSVEIESSDYPITIKVNMENESGIFQIEKVLGEKIRTSSIRQYIKVIAIKNGKELRTYVF
ncbi:MAG: HD domain-containing protein [Candidatus Aenigmatarchaeota archaeon]